MGFSGELQYGLAIVLIAVLINFVILNYKLDKFKKHAVVAIIFYTIIKVELLKIFNFDKNIIDLAIVTMIFLFHKFF